MIEVIGGSLYQWDTGRKLKVTPDEGKYIHEVHFTTKEMTTALPVETKTENGILVADIPNKILQQEKKIYCYEIIKNDIGEQSVSETVLDLKRRNKPGDYVYTETELKNFEALEKSAVTEKELDALLIEMNGGNESNE